MTLTDNLQTKSDITSSLRNPIKVALYIRVSTSKQEVDNQLLQLRSYCLQKSYNIVGIYTDIISGKESKRPQYDLLFHDAHQQKFSLVLFWALDRFSRGGTEFTLRKLSELEHYGVNWESYQEQYISSIGPFRDVIISLLASIAKIEREKISERTKAGLERAKAKGKQPGRPKGSKDKKKRKVKNYYGHPNYNKGKKKNE